MSREAFDIRVRCSKACLNLLVTGHQVRAWSMNLFHHRSIYNGLWHTAYTSFVKLDSARS